MILPKIFFKSQGIDIFLNDNLHWTIRWYGISYILSYYIILYRVKKYIESQSIPISSRELDRLAEYSFISGIIGGRLWYLIERFIEESIPIWYKPFHIWEGGMGFQGGLLIGAIGGIIYCFAIKKQKYISLLLDIIVSNIPLAIMIGRIGNFLNHEFINSIDIANHNNITVLPALAVIFVYCIKNIFSIRLSDYATIILMLLSAIDLILIVNDISYGQSRLHNIIFFICLCLINIKAIIKMHYKLNTDHPLHNNLNKLIAILLMLKIGFCVWPIKSMVLPQAIFASLTEGLLLFMIIQSTFKYTINYKYLTTTVFGIAYCVLRYTNDVFRDEPAVFDDLKLSQIVCMIIFCTSLFGFFIISKKKVKIEDIIDK